MTAITKSRRRPRRNLALLYNTPHDPRAPLGRGATYRETDASMCPPEILQSERADGLFDRQAMEQALWAAESGPPLRTHQFLLGDELYRVVSLQDTRPRGSPRIRHRFNGVDILAAGPVVVVNARHLLAWW